ncbi:LuxR C-terminal-related transcriptional regulator [Sphingosinicella sp. BN140058]|uniref:LuxR C-terminal-related transcriptional regulator n=1 Tax=Sphingosinicella sp. BN140058 TaxID=1892855 RepID=UPI001011EE85|nr:LuxR C-terminal-related transcriptional regulator [Sphingosinicella sp. BN140058]QAY76697.1 PAS domain-containing protein [Sphingosinicella sp. BN140058]
MPVADDEEALFASIRLSPIAAIVTDPRLPDNPIRAVNSAFETLTGYSQDELIGRNCRILAGPGTEEAPLQAMRDAIRDAKPVMTELLNYRRDGTAFRNAVMVAPLFDDEGRLAYFIGSQMDVTDADARDAIARAEAARGRLTALTERQREVLQQMALGLRNKQIAAALGINEKTVKMHRAALLVRLNAATSADAVRLAVEAGL